MKNKNNDGRTDEGFIKKAIDAIVADCEDEEKKEELISMRDSYMEINADGKIYSYMPIPQSVRDKSRDELLALFKEEGLDNVILTDTHFANAEKTMDGEMRGDDLYVRTKQKGCTYDDDGNEVSHDPREKRSSDDDKNVICFFTSEYERM